MYQCLKRLWNDDEGALIATEWLIMATIPVLGMAAGMGALRDSVNDELKQFGHSVHSLRQSYTYSGLAGTGARAMGAAAGGRPARGSGMTMGPAATSPAAAELPAF